MFSDWRSISESLPDGMDTDPLIRGVRPFLPIKPTHGEAASVVNPDKLPVVVQYWATCMAGFRRRSVVQDPVVIVEQLIVFERELGLIYTLWMSDNVGASM
jgi:hypothetical protein